MPPQPAQIHHHHQQPMRVALVRRESNEAATVMDNTPPTTPDSSISNISGSPRDERATPSSSEDNSKLNRDSSEAENDSGGKSSGPGLSEDDGMTLANTSAKPPAKRGLGSDAESISPMKKRKKRNPDGSSTSNQSNVSGKKSPRQSSSRNTRQAGGSDSDDTSEGSSQCNTASQSLNAGTNLNLTGINSAGNTDLSSFSSRSPRPTKYNFCIDLGKDNWFNDVEIFFTMFII